MTPLKAMSGVSTSSGCLAVRKIPALPSSRSRPQCLQRVSATSLAPQQTEVYGPANPAMRPRKTLQVDQSSGTVLGKLGGAEAVQVALSVNSSSKLITLIQ